MFRVVLNTYLALVALAGPWLCCCTTTRPGSESTASCDRAASRPAHGCCGHHHHAGQQQHDAPADGSESPSHPDEHRCPCDGGRANNTALTHGDSATTFPRLLTRDVLPGDFTPVAVPFAMAEGSSVSKGLRSSAFPRMTSQEILRALQRLLC